MADNRVFDDPCWPYEIRQDVKRLYACYTRAMTMLGFNSFQDDQRRPVLPKLEALKASAAVMGKPILGRL